jgi:hypothetical protein
MISRPKTRRNIEHETLISTFVARYTPLLERLGERASHEILRDAITASDPASGLARLLAEIGPLDPPAPDPLAGARARGALAKQEMLEAAGGVYRVSQVAKLLGVSRQAVDGRRVRGTLLAVPRANGEWVYPACQFTGDGVVPGLDEFLRAFPVPTPWTQLSILLAHSPRLDGRSPIEALRSGDTGAACAVAREYGEHAA